MYFVDKNKAVNSLVVVFPQLPVIAIIGISNLRLYSLASFIKKIMEQYSKEYGIDFLYRDFRVGFWEGHQKAHDLGLYMQKYCGCIFSEEDRYSKQIKRDKE